jgi:heme A synthase
VLLAALVQAGLGITTLLLVVPVSLAALHQAGALVLFGVGLWLIHELRPGAAGAAAVPVAGPSRAAGVAA